MLVGVLVMLQSAVLGHGDPSDEKSSGRPGAKLETLLKEVLEGVDGTEVIVSRVTIPPNTSLPKHWHPGEEFAYILEGSATLWQKGKEDIVGRPGDVLMVPLKQVHTAVTKDEGATILVFRVHEQGKPERVPVEDN
jgi:quercetin dioxygenase-like cupin family protein